MTDWLSNVVLTNGLQTATQPWHLIIAYDQFSEEGVHLHSGTFEEFWAGPNKYKRAYKSDNLKQTDVATDHGLFRSGDQRWPNAAELPVRSEVVDPFHFAETRLQDHTRNVERTFGSHSLDCVFIESAPGPITPQPTQYCFEHGGTALRYSWGLGWDQTSFNDIRSLQGRSVAGDIDVTHAGTPYLKLRVQLLEQIPGVDDADLTVPADAISLQGKRISGVPMRPNHIEFPEWPSSIKEREFTVSIELVVGKNGHVLSARAVSGPADAYKAAENCARKWTFPPYLVLGEPAEVETKINLSRN